jgi:hypothetical protein
MVTGHGIVVGVDGKGIPMDRKTLADLRPTMFKKVMLLRNRFILCTVGYGAIIGDPRIQYNFNTWARTTIEDKLNEHSTVEQLAALVAEEAYRVFAPMNGHLPDYVKPDRVVVAEYIVAGYDASVPKLYTVKLTSNHTLNKIVPPKPTLVYPSPGHEHDDWVVGQSGEWHVWAHVEPESDNAKKFAGIIPSEFKVLQESDKPQLTMGQAINVAHVTIDLEIEASPSDVGYPITIVAVPKYGEPFVKTYSTKLTAPRKASSGGTKQR